jgi:signal peptidase I
MKKQTAYDKQELKRGYLSLLFKLAVTAAVLVLFFSFVCLLWRVQGQEMFPAVRDGDLLLASRLDKQYSRGDVVIYEAEGQRRVGRIVARESDRLEITKDGNLTVNGAMQSEAVFYPTQAEQEDFSVQVPEGCVYILGDHRDACRDSRDFGPVPAEHVKGKVIGLLRIRGF